MPIPKSSALRVLILSLMSVSRVLAAFQPTPTPPAFDSCAEICRRRRPLRRPNFADAGGTSGPISSLGMGRREESEDGTGSNERRRDGGGQMRRRKRRRPGRRGRFPRANRATLDFNERLKSLIRGSGGRGGGIHAAHDLLLSTLDRVRSGEETDVVLNTIAFTTVINGWARSDARDAGDRALDLLAVSAELYAGGDVGSKPNSYTFSGTIRALTKSRRGSAKAASRAEALLRLMDRLYADGDDDVVPDGILFTTVMNAWANVRGRGGGSKAAEGAESLLRRMDELHRSGVPEAKPDAIAYSSAIKAWASASASSASGRRADAAERAEALLREMEGRYAETGDPDVKPDAIAYTTVIRAWTSGGGGGGDDGAAAAERAERLLDNMEARYRDTGDLDVKPDSVLFGTVIDAWADSGSVGCAERAAAVLRRMTDLHAAGDEDVKPDAVSYTALIKALASDAAAGVAGSAERAERVLRGMEGRYAETGDVDLRPDAVAYGTVINAWAASGEEGSAERAEAVLRRMEEHFAGGNEDARPDVAPYTAVLKAWALSRGRDDIAAKRAEELLGEMIQRCDEGDISFKSTSDTFEWALKAVERGEDESIVERVEALKQKLSDKI